jgi:hypothetical protein
MLLLLPASASAAPAAIGAVVTDLKSGTAQLYEPPTCTDQTVSLIKSELRGQVVRVKKVFTAKDADGEETEWLVIGLPSKDQCVERADVRLSTDAAIAPAPKKRPPTGSPIGASRGLGEGQQ